MGLIVQDFAAKFTVYFIPSPGSCIRKSLSVTRKSDLKRQPPGQSPYWRRHWASNQNQLSSGGSWKHFLSVLLVGLLVSSVLLIPFWIKSGNTVFILQVHMDMHQTNKKNFHCCVGRRMLWVIGTHTLFNLLVFSWGYFHKSFELFRWTRVSRKSAL